MAENLNIAIDTSGDEVFYKKMSSGSLTLATKGTYIDKNIKIDVETNGEVIENGVEIISHRIEKSNVVNNTITLTPKIELSDGSSKQGTSTTVTAADVTSGSITITKNETNDVTNYKEVITDVSPLIVNIVVTNSDNETRTMSFSGLPSQPIAWTLDMNDSTTNTAWDNIYRCISARYNGEVITGYTVYKRNGNNTPYIYMATRGLTQSYSNGTLTLTIANSGGISDIGPFLARPYVLMAVCKNDGTNDIYRG